jgi:hypothetical protein
VLEILHSAHQGVTGMKARAKVCVFWPEMNGDITNRRLQCNICTAAAPSQSDEPLLVTSVPQYPFDQVVIDYFFLKGHKYLLYADRYSGWLTIVKIKLDQGDSKFLKKHLSNLFSVYGAPNEISCDGGSPFNSHDFREFLITWGINLRQSSAYYAQSNGRAELAVKVAKRLLCGNSGPNGDIDNDRVARALLQYRNTPLQGVDLSPAQILYGRVLKDHMPIMPDVYNIRGEWKVSADKRESALQKRHVKTIETYNTHTKTLPELYEREHVAVQNQNGTHPTRWDKTGTVVECLPHRQYKIKMDGSGRVTMRNRKFLRRISPVCCDSKMSKPYLHAEKYNSAESRLDDDVYAPPSIPNSTGNVLNPRTIDIINDSNTSDAPAVHETEHIQLDNNYDTVSTDNTNKAVRKFEEVQGTGDRDNYLVHSTGVKHICTKPPNINIVFEFLPSKGEI